MVTKEDFLKNPRTKEIREICLTIAASAQRLLHDTHVDKKAEYAILDQAQSALSTLGITASMNIDLSVSAYEDPVTLAEWLAGQWLDGLIRKFTTEKIIQSINNDAIFPMLISFEVIRSLIQTTYDFLDVKVE